MKIAIAATIAISVILVASALVLTESPARSPTMLELASSGSTCGQRTASIHLSPPSGSATSAILAAYRTLGAEGGGTLYLNGGVFTLDSTLNLQGYGNVSIEGAGQAKTTIQMMPDPVGHFTGTSGSILGRMPNGTALNLIEVSGTKGPLWNFEMCDLTVNANANTAKQAWKGSLIYDYSGGRHHVYTNIALVGFWGPSTTPNGLHLIGSPSGAAATGYVVNHLTAENNTVPFESYSGFRGGPNFLNVGGLSGCRITNVTGIGLVALEYAPAQNCFFGYWTITGHLLVDPLVGGSWAGSRFAHIVVSENGTAAPDAVQVSTKGEPFSAMYWIQDTFYGPVLDAVNMISVSDSTFYGGLNALPATFVGNTVVYTNPGPDSMGLPIRVDGDPGGGSAANVTGNSFSFPGGTSERAPLLVTVPNLLLLHDRFIVNDTHAKALVASPKVELTDDSCLAGLQYQPTGSSPSQWSLYDLALSPGFKDLGAWVGKLMHITNDLPLQGVEPHICHAILLGGASNDTNGTIGTASSSSGGAPPTNWSASGDRYLLAAPLLALPVLTRRREPEPPPGRP